MKSKIGFIPHNKLDKFFDEEQDKVIRHIVGTYKLREAEAKDCFQEGCIALWKNIKEGKLTRENLAVSFSAYFMRCCCNHATHILEKKKKEIPYNPFNPFHDKTPNEGTDAYNSNDERIGRLKKTIENPSKPHSTNPVYLSKDERIELLENIVRNLPEPCNTILWNVYYNYHEIKEQCQGKETIMDVIALILGMKKSVLSTTKNRCMKKLKDKVNETLLTI